MLVRRPDATRPLVDEARRPGVIPSTRNPGTFSGWGPKL
jgi:hypothetical protein